MSDMLEMVESALRLVDFDTITTVEAKACREFSDLMEIYKRDLTITQSIEDCVAVSCAVHVATQLDGDPLWMYLVGAPSSGKSTICELICADEYNTKPLSKFTGLVSGSVAGQHLAPLLHGKCVVIKDGTLLLESSPMQLSSIFGELRDIFDGSLEAHYRNGVEASFSGISFGMLIGITERVYGLDLAALGERFLHVRLETERTTELERNKSAIAAIFANTGKTSAAGSEDLDSRQFPTQRSYTAGFLQHLHDQVAFKDVLRPEWDEDDALLIQSLADVIACSRASVPTDSKDNILYDSRPEASTRVVKQLARLALSLCYVYNVKYITSDIRRLLVKVARDTAHSRQYSIINALATAEGGLTRTGISAKTNVSIEQVRKVVDSLLSLGICEQSHTTVATVVGLPDTTSSLLTVPTWIKEAYSYGQNDEEDQGVGEA